MDAQPKRLYDPLPMEIQQRFYISNITARLKTMAFQEILEGEDDYTVRME